MPVRKRASMIFLAVGGALSAIAAMAQTPQPSAPPDFTKMPDVMGVRIGMSPREATAALRKGYQLGIDPLQVAFGPGGSMRAYYALRIQDDSHGTEVGVDFTLPPGPQIVWHVARMSPQPNVNRAVLLAALRQKYGRESLDLDWFQQATHNDADIAAVWWVMDEQGRAAANVQMAPGSGPLGCTAPGYTAGVPPTVYSIAPNGLPKLTATDFCSHRFVGVLVRFSTGASHDIIKSTTTEVMDYPLLTRSALATDAFIRGAGQALQRQQRDKSKSVKPVL